MAAFRCSICALNYPLKKDYQQCPQCFQETTKFNNLKPISIDEARSIKLHSEFERFYAEWDADHDPDRLEPDAEAAC